MEPTAAIIVRAYDQMPHINPSMMEFSASDDSRIVTLRIGVCGTGECERSIQIPLSVITQLHNLIGQL